MGNPSAHTQASSYRFSSAGAGGHKGRPYIWRERYHCRTVGAGLVPARVSLAPAAEEKEDAHAGGVRVLLV